MSHKQTVYNFATALELLREGPASLSPAALAAFSGASKKDIAAFAPIWVELPVEQRRRTSKMLVDLAGENIRNDFNVLFRYMLNDEDARVRVHAIDGLWEDEDSSLVKPLVGFLRSDPDRNVRATAAESLGRFVLLVEYERLAQPGLASLMRDALVATIHSSTEDTVVRARALESLAYWSDDRMRAIIAAAYEDPDAEMRASAISAMGRSADSFWRATAAGELESPDSRMRLEAARAVGELEDRSSVPRLIELLDDGDGDVQSAAITALGQIGGRLARQALLRVADSEDEAAHDRADEALQELEFTSNSDQLLLDLVGEPADELEELSDEDWDTPSEPEDEDEMQELEEMEETDDDSLEE